MTEQPWALMARPPGVAAFLGLGLGEPICKGQSQQALGQEQAGSEIVII